MTRPRRASHWPTLTISHEPADPRRAITDDYLGNTPEPPRDWAEQRREGYSTARATGGVILIMIMALVILLAVLLT